MKAKMTTSHEKEPVQLYLMTSSTMNLFQAWYKKKKLRLKEAGVRVGYDYYSTKERDGEREKEERSERRNARERERKLGLIKIDRWPFCSEEPFEEFLSAFGYSTGVLQTAMSSWDLKKSKRKRDREFSALIQWGQIVCNDYMVHFQFEEVCNSTSLCLQ